MIQRAIFSSSNISFPGTWKPLFGLGLSLALLGFCVLAFSRLIIFLLAIICFLSSFSLLRAALRAYWGEKKLDQKDVIEVL